MNGHQRVSAISARRPPRHAARRFVRSDEGTTVIEFALLAFPFFLLIFAIVESCAAFAAQQLVANATDDIARMFRTGQVKVSDQIDKEKLHEMVCDRIDVLMSSGCPGLEVDLRQYDSFEDAAREKPLDANGDITTMVDPGPSLSKNMLRIYYRWPVITNRLAKTLPDGKMLLFAATAWQNEPFND